MLIKNKIKLDNLIVDLQNLLSDKKVELFKLDKKITLDTDYWIEEDYKATQAYLRTYRKNQIPNEINNIKPKGKILIILSYNEPFILSIIPVLNALVVGNEIILKPSDKNKLFAEIIWQQSGLIKKYNLKLKIISAKKEEIINFIKKVRAVYFFGSYRVARKIAEICGKNFTEFYPEIETSDLKVFHENRRDIKTDVLLTLKESFIHSGQTCQRIQGIYVHNDFYNEYTQILKEEFVKFSRSRALKNYIAKNFVAARKNLLNELLFDIKKSKPLEVIRTKSLPILVINPDKKSDFVRNAYFLPVLWISPYSSKEQLVEILNLRKFFLGLNIQDSSGNFADYLITNTKFTRYTINNSHTNVRPKEGWGGSWPSGYSGYVSWVEHFSERYAVIK